PTSAGSGWRAPGSAARRAFTSMIDHHLRQQLSNVRHLVAPAGVLRLGDSRPPLPAASHRGRRPGTCTQEADIMPEMTIKTAAMAGSGPVSLKRLAVEVRRPDGASIHASTLSRWAIRGLGGVRLKSVVSGGRRYIRPADLEAFFAEVAA